MAFSIDQVRLLLLQHPGSDKHQLVRLLSRDGRPAVTTSDLNRDLYGHPEVFRWSPGRGERRIWFAHSETAPPEQDLTALLVAGQLGLYPWQTRALVAWRQRHSRGVIEAVTAAGKTRLALAAAYLALAEHRSVAVVVPTVALVDQWISQFECHLRGRFPAMRVGKMGGGATDDLSGCDVLVATVQSAADRYMLPAPHGLEGLLVADEAHHYGAPRWSRALEASFGWRLGLTATYEREDGGVEAHLDPYFGGTCYSLDYGEALADRVIARFKIAFVGIRLEPHELLLYQQEDQKASRYRKRLVNDFGVTSEPFGAFMREVCVLKSTGSGEGSRCAGFYLGAFSKRRAVLANAGAKFSRLGDLAPAVRHADRSILFAQTRQAAAAAVSALAQRGVRGKVLDATMGLDERKIVFAGFEEGTHELVAAPKLLDEGIDVPAADLAIVLASSRSRRQMVQRLGRVVRQKADGRLARIAILFAEGTSEDPEHGAHEEFVDLIADVAEELEVFPSGTGAQEITQYLNDWAGADNT